MCWLLNVYDYSTTRIEVWKGIWEFGGGIGGMEVSRREQPTQKFLKNNHFLFVFLKNYSYLCDT